MVKTEVVNLALDVLNNIKQTVVNTLNYRYKEKFENQSISVADVRDSVTEALAKYLGEKNEA